MRENIITTLKKTKDEHMEEQDENTRTTQEKRKTNIRINTRKAHEQHMKQFKTNTKNTRSNTVRNTK